VFPEVDSVPVLKEYAVKYGVNEKWNLVTGDKRNLYHG
jgi:protein SCO1/2